MNQNKCPFCSSNKFGILGYPEFCCVVCYICGAKGPEADTDNEAWDKWQQRYITRRSSRAANADSIDDEKHNFIQTED